MASSQYDDFASSYGYEGLPLGVLEAELMALAMGDLTGLTVLDLGGGSGIWARPAVAAGAQSVDVVDTSAEMLAEGQKLETQGKIRWMLGDATKPDLGVKGGEKPQDAYDVVMCNYLFEHAGSDEGLEAMFGAAAGHLKQSGKLINIRVLADVYHNMVDKKYGAEVANFEQIPGGLKYVVHFADADQPFSLEATSMWQTLNLSNEINERHGLSKLHVLPVAATDTVRKDAAFWQEMVDHPCIAVCIAVKL